MTHLIAVLVIVICVLTACSGGSLAVARNESPAATPVPSAININTATPDELTRIPHIGEKIAARIIDYREINGPFRRVEHLMLIQGVSDDRFRKIRPLVKAE